MKKIFYSVFMLMFALLSSQTVNAAGEAEVLFEESFAKGEGSFTVEGVDIWYWAAAENFYTDGLKMMANGKDATAGTYFVSPEITLGTANTLQFKHNVSYCWMNDLQNRAAVYVRTIGGEWKKLEGVPFPLEQSSTPNYVDVNVAFPEEYNGQAVQFAFGYNSTGDMFSGQEAWYINSVVVKGVKEDKPVESGDIYNVVFDTQEAIDTWNVEGYHTTDPDFKTLHTNGNMQICSSLPAEKDLQTSYVVSPFITLSSKGNVASFNHAVHPGKGLPMEELLGLVVRTEGGEWVEIPVLNYTDNFREPVNSGDLKVPAEFNGQKVQFAFKYLWDGGNNTCMWFINDFKVVAAEDVNTGIQNVNKTVISDNRIYDLQGRIVKNPSNGIYVINGKKVIIK